MNWNKKHISSLVFASLFLFSFKADQQFNKVLAAFKDGNSGYVMVAAHRAGHNGYVENSIQAIKHAIEIGVDIIELDVKVTKDSVVVLNHDGKIDRTTNGTGDPEKYTWAELQQFRLEMPDGTLTNEILATFEEALLLAKGKALIDIDIKTGNLKPVVDVIKKTGTQNQVFFFDNDYDALKEVLTMLPEAILMPRAYSYEMADSALRVFAPEVVHIDESFYTPELTNHLKKKDARIWINALDGADRQIRIGNGPAAIDSLLRFGANIIQTDEPEKLIEILKEKGLRKL
jgi:glycerophosphoryl diester phosphodiesterase